MASDYNYNRLCADFIAQKEENSSTAQNRMSYKGTELYSYTSLLATLHKQDKIVVYYSDIAHYSNTSHGHFRALIEEVKNYGYILLKSRDTTTDSMYDDFYKMLRTYKRSRVERTRTVRKQLLLKEHNSIVRFFEFVKIDKRTKVYKHLTKIQQILFKEKIL